MPRPCRPSTIYVDEFISRFVSDWLDDNERTVGWLQNKLAAMSAMPKGQLYRALRNERAYRVNEAVAIAKLLGVSLTVLTGAEQTNDARLEWATR